MIGLADGATIINSSKALGKANTLNIDCTGISKSFAGGKYEGQFSDHCSTMYRLWRIFVYLKEFKHGRS